MPDSMRMMPEELAGLADDAVMGISLYARTGECPQHLLEAGIRLCEYLRTIEVQGDPGSGRTDLQEQVDENKRILMEAMKGTRPAEEKLAQIEEFLIRSTTGPWRTQVSEFQEKRLKRELRVNG